MYIDALMVTAMVALVMFITPWAIRGCNIPCVDKAVVRGVAQAGDHSWPR